MTAAGPKCPPPPRGTCPSAYAYPLLIEAVGEGEPSAALAPEVGAFRAPHRKRLAEHRPLPALPAHEDYPPGETPGRTVHAPTPSAAVPAGGQLGTSERPVQGEPPSS